MMVSKPATAELGASRSFYFWLSLWMWAIAITGFGPGAVSGLLGGTFVELVPGGSPFPVEPGGELEDTQGAVSLISLLLKFVSGSEE